MENINSLIDIINDCGIKLQHEYYQHERYFDRFTTDDFDSLDNAAGNGDANYIYWNLRDGNKDGAMKELEATFAWFKQMNDKCRRRGWDYNASQRGFDTTSPLAAVWTYTSLAILKLNELKKRIESYELDLQ